MHEDGKNMSPQNNRKQTKPDNAKGNILKCKANINWSVFQIVLFFLLP